MKQDNITSHIVDKVDRVDRGWKGMHHTLDKEMPQKKDRKVLFWILIGLGIGIVASLFLVTSREQTDNTIAIADPIIQSQSEKTPPKKSTEKIIVTTENLKAPASNRNNKISQSKKVYPSEINNSANTPTTQKAKVIDDSNRLDKATKKTKARNQSNANPVSLTEIKQNAIPAESNVSSKLITVSTKVSNNTDRENMYQITNKSMVIPAIGLQRQLLNYERILTMDFLPTVASPSITSTPNYETTVILGADSDYFTSLNAVGTSAVLGLQVSKNRWSIGISGGYTQSLYSWKTIQNFSSDSQLPSGVRVTDELNNQDQEVSVGVNANEYRSIQPLEESMKYLSVGVSLNYEINRRFSLHSSVGKQYHLNDYVISPQESLTSVPIGLNPAPETITLNYNNSLYLASGIEYKMSPVFSVSASYRYNPTRVIDIENYSRNTSKVSLGLRYNL